MITHRRFISCNEIIKHYKRLIDKAETCVNDLMAEFNSVITTVTGIGNRLGAVILAEIQIFMPLIILLNYKLSLDWILLFISQVRLIYQKEWSNGVPLICGRYSYKLPKHALTFHLLLRLS
ncbi:hypothetical protein [Streptococcus pneumoniae]|uniref:hypothetical protein n=1 Tax=Streptococcus pneumoniae TaxID=1313 RepID=UPI003CC7A2DD